MNLGSFQGLELRSLIDWYEICSDRKLKSSLEAPMTRWVFSRQLCLHLLSAAITESCEILYKELTFT